MTLQYLQTPVPGRVGGSTLIVLAIRGDAATDQLEVAEIHDVSFALGGIPENTPHRLVPAADFRPWPPADGVHRGTALRVPTGWWAHEMRQMPG